MSKDPEDEEERARREALGRREEQQEFYSENHRKLHNQEIQVFSGGEGTFLNRAMFDHFDIEDEISYEEKQKRLNERVNGAPFEDTDRKQLYEAVQSKVEGALKSGNLQDVDPEPHPTDENAVSYKVGEHSLDQTELDNGMFKFAPGGKFTGVLRVERRGSDGELLPDSADIIEYKDGKPVSVIPGPEGETRVADFGMISRAAGISVSKAKDTGISVSKAKTVTDDRSPSIGDSHAPDPAPTSKAGPLVKREADGQKLDFKLVMSAFKEKIFPRLSEEHKLASNAIFDHLKRASKEKSAIVPVKPAKEEKKDKSKGGAPEVVMAIKLLATMMPLIMGAGKKDKVTDADIQKIEDALAKVDKEVKAEQARKKVSGMGDGLFGGKHALQGKVVPPGTPATSINDGKGATRRR